MGQIKELDYRIYQPKGIPNQKIKGKCDDDIYNNLHICFNMGIRKKYNSVHIVDK